MSKDKEILNKIGGLVQKKIKQNYKSNVEFAYACNIAESTVRRIIQGEQNLTIKLLQKICDGLDMKLSELFKEIGK